MPEEIIENYKGKFSREEKVRHRPPTEHLRAGDLQEIPRGVRSPLLFLLPGPDLPRTGVSPPHRLDGLLLL